MTSKNEYIMYRLVELRQEHKKVKAAINSITEEPAANQLELYRMQKKKSALKHQISQMETGIVPNIIA